MSLIYAILGLLQQQQMTGYDLKTACFDQTIAHLWPADQAQIYRTLDKLESQGWITCTVEVQQDRPNRKIYQITAVGQKALKQWLQTPQVLPIGREPFLVQLHFAAQIPNQAILDLLEHQLAAHRQKQADCAAIKFSQPKDASMSREQFLQQLVQESIMRREQAYIDWLTQTIGLIQQLPEL